jgi:phosphoribosylanthranilate isomerase
MIVKICGIRTLEDALVAADSGADMLGFNFYRPSPRYITPQVCTNVVSKLKTHHSNIITVGVFVNETPDRAQKIVEFCGLDLAQLSGDETGEELAVWGGRAFKAVRPRSLKEADESLRIYGSTQAPALLVDTQIKGAYGGTGKTGDWALARHLAVQAPVLLAGGLTPENVAGAIHLVNPWGVDVASGVESSPGVKEASKILAFISSAKSDKGK